VAFLSKKIQYYVSVIIFQTASYTTLPGGDAPENAMLFHQVMQEQRPSALVDMVCLNAGAAMYCYGAVDSILAGVELSQEMLSKGFAYQKYQEYCQVASQN
jgi:anthranilate phosphoribosyltransferase